MTRFLAPALALGLLLCAPARAGAAPVIGAIEVEGTRRVEVDAVKAAVSSKPGEPLDERKLDADVRGVVKLGFFSDVAVELRGDPSRPTVVFRVAEKPAVVEVKIEGNEEQMAKSKWLATIDRHVPLQYDFKPLAISPEGMEIALAMLEVNRQLFECLNAEWRFASRHFPPKTDGIRVFSLPFMMSCQLPQRPRCNTLRQSCLQRAAAGFDCVESV